LGSQIVSIVIVRFWQLPLLPRMCYGATPLLLPPLLLLQQLPPLLLQQQQQQQQQQQ